MALWRIPDKHADLVLCVNFPVREEGGPELDNQLAKTVFETAVKELRIKDYGLFAE